MDFLPKAAIKMNNSTAANATKITTWRKLLNGFKALDMLESTFAAAEFAGTEFVKLDCKFPTITAATATTTMAKTLAI